MASTPESPSEVDMAAAHLHHDFKDGGPIEAHSLQEDVGIESTQFGITGNTGSAVSKTEHLSVRPSMSLSLRGILNLI